MAMRGPGKVCVVAIAALALVAGSASAQDEDPYGGRSGGTLTKPKTDPNQPPPPPPPQAPTIKLPVLIKDDGAEYPREAIEANVREVVTVTLIVEIDATGAVKKATVEAAQGHGFDAAAEAAAMKVQFSPATRNGVPIAARIKHKYVFTPPPGRIVGKIVDASNRKPVPTAKIVARGADGVDHAAESGDDGTYRIEPLPPGAYHVSIAAAGFKPQEADEDIGPAQETKTLSRLDLEAPPPAVGTSTPKPKSPTDVEDVVVRGQRPPREVTKRTISAEELQRIPGSNGDALRSLQNLPGVARPPGLAGLLIVRGSGPQDTNVFVDGTLIPLVYHFGGLSSVVPTEILDRIDFYPGNFGATYGRVMGGVVDIGIRSPKTDKIHGLAQVDLIDARMLAEGPLGKGWSFSVSGRRSWVDTWLKPVLVATGAGVSTAPVYYDYQATLEKRFDKNSTLRMMVYGSDDKIDILIKSVNASAPGLAGGISAHTGFWRAQARYENKISKDTEFRITGAIGQDFVEFSLGDIFFNVLSYPITSRVELSHKLGIGVKNNIGMDMYYAPYTVELRAPPLPQPGQPPPGPFGSQPPLTTSDTDSLYRPALFDELEIVPWKGGRIVPGIRVDYARDTKKWDVSPRFSARQDVGPAFPRTTIKGGAGIYYQPPQPFETNAVFGIPNLESNRAYHYALGAEREITKYLEVSEEAFYKQLDHLVTGGVGNVGRGRIYGLETLIRWKPDGRFFGWLAYTLSRSERQDLPTSPVRLAQFDQTHILTVLGSYKLGHGWEFGMRYRLVSGNLYTPSTYGFYDVNAGAYLAERAFPVNGSRLPLFHELDIRVDKTWRFQSWQLGWYADVINVYNQGNVEGVSYNYNYTKSTFATGLPFLPSIGLRGEL